MCNSNGGSDGACCPPAQFFQEKICGNFVGVGTGPQLVWSAPAGDYFEGAFQAFNSAASPDNISINIARVDGSVVSESATPGSTVSLSVINPVSLTIFADVGESGTYCMTLYKRVLA